MDNVLASFSKLSLEQKTELLQRLMNEGHPAGREAKERPAGREVKENVPEIEAFARIESVIGGRFVASKGEWEWHIKFSDKSEEWVPDHDCDCNEAISKWCGANRVRTIYNVSRVSSAPQARGVSLQAQSAQLANAPAGSSSSAPTSSSTAPAQGQLMTDVRRIIDNVPNENAQLNTGAKNDAKTRVQNISIIGSSYEALPRRLQNIVNSCNNGDEIRVWRVDRFSRNVESVHELVKLAQRNVNVVAVNDNVSFLENKVRFVELLTVANRESESISKRVKSSREFLRMQGHEYVGGRIPFGKKMERAPDGRRLLVNQDDEMKAIRIITDNIITGASSYSVILALKRARLSYRGKPWTFQIVERLFDRNNEHDVKYYRHLATMRATSSLPSTLRRSDAMSFVARGSTQQLGNASGAERAIDPYSAPAPTPRSAGARASSPPRQPTSAREAEERRASIIHHFTSGATPAHSLRTSTVATARSVASLIAQREARRAELRSRRQARAVQMSESEESDYTPEDSETDEEEWSVETGSVKRARETGRETETKKRR